MATSDMDLWATNEGWEDDAARQAITIDDFSDDEEFNGNGKRIITDQRSRLFEKRAQRGQGVESTDIEPSLEFIGWGIPTKEPRLFPQTSVQKSTKPTTT